MSHFSGIDLKYSTFVEILRIRASRQPERQAYTFLLDGDEAEVHITYGELDRRARAIARQLQLSGAKQGDRALLLYPPGLEYIAGFFGCLYAGVVAVPAYPPRNGRSIPRVLAVMRNAKVWIALTTRPLFADLHSWLGETCDGNGLRWMVTSDFDSATSTAWHEPDLHAETLAFLQYTSGSTGAPRGVKLSHCNLIHNSAVIEKAFEVTAESRIVSWLPPYHDMGLIGCVLQPLYVGATAILMSPGLFMQRPLRWLNAIARFRATHSGGPNFAYELCVDRTTPQQRAGLDLRSWKVAFNGAEPVRAETLRRFTSAFESTGLRPEIFAPCYGLAESALLVCGGRSCRPPTVKTVQGAALEQNRVVEATGTGSRTLVGCGRIPSGQQVVIVDPETLKPCGGQIGEIWVAGPSVSQGYWNLPDQTERTFNAHLSDTKEGPFLRTGDLGFLEGGELFVTGRIKDLVIICGRNLYPQDIELTVKHSHPSFSSGSTAAFSVVLEGEERLVVAQEEGRRPLSNPQDVARAIRGAVAEEHGVQVHAVEFFKLGRLPKTSSGKVQRYACKEQYLTGTLSSHFARV